MLRSKPLPLALLSSSIILTAATYVILALAWSTPGYERTGDETIWFSTWPILFLAYPVVGSLVASRHPRNAVGWLFCGVGLLWALSFSTAAYAAYGLKAHPGSLPGALTADWFQSWSFFPGLGLILVYAPLLFPTGRPLGPRWRIVVWSGAVGIMLTAIVFAFEPELNDGLGGFANPYSDFLPGSLSAGFAIVGFPLTLGSAIAASTSMVLRLRRSRGEEREQLKWIAFAAAVVAVAFTCHLVLSFSGLGERIEWYGVLWGMALCGLPVAAGLAILRQGLFDIDLVVNRTLVYTVLTALVAGLYILLVVGAGALFQTEGGSCRSLPPAWSPSRFNRCENGCNGE